MIKGVYTALITPFTDDLKLDLEGFRENIRFQIQEGVDGLVILGTTAESPTLTSDEQEECIRVAVEEVQNRVPLWVGTGSASTEETVKKTLKAKELGADGALIVTPYYNRPTQEGLYQHFATVATKTSFPIILYSILGRTGVNLSVETCLRLMEFPEIVGIKEASGNLSQMMEIIRQKKPHFSVLSGDDNLTLPLISVGGHGVISVLSNLIPSQICKLTHLALEGNYDEAREIHYRLLPLIQMAFIESNPSPIKTMMKTLGMKSGPVRLPLTSLTQENHWKLEQCLNETLISQN